MPPTAARSRKPRLPVIATLVLAGLRIDELCGLRREHLDFARGVLVVSRDITKTDAGERTIPMLPALRELLLEHVIELRVTPEEPCVPPFEASARGVPRREGSKCFG